MHLIFYNKIVKKIMSLYWYFIDNHSVVSRSSRAQQYAISVKLPSTLKNHCELKTCLTDKPDTVLESSENSEQNKWGWFFDFFVKIFCTGPLSIYVKIFAKNITSFMARSEIDHSGKRLLLKLGHS